MIIFEVLQEVTRVGMRRTAQD